MEYSRHANFDATMQELQANILGSAPSADAKTRKMVTETKRLIKLARPNKKAPSDAQIIETLSRKIKEASPQHIGGGLVHDISGEIGNMFGHALPALATIAEFL